MRRVQGWRSVVTACAMMMVAVLAACGGGDGEIDPNSIVAKDFWVSSPGEGDVQLFVRNKHLAAWSKPAPNKTILFVHGATFAGSATFDLPIGGESWMDWLARRGYDVYSVDLRGYGRSGRPAAMKADALKNLPIADTEAALEDVAKVVEFIRSRQSVEKVTLIGWSWGATVAARYAIMAPSKVDRLVLYAPQGVRDQVLPASAAPAGAWRLVPVDVLKPTLGKGIPPERREEFIPKHWQKLWDETLDKVLDPEAPTRTPPSVMLPNGAMTDYVATWGAKKEAWDPKQLVVPTLVVQGGWDQDSPPHMGLEVLSKLTSARASRYLLIPEGTHTIMLEKGRAQLFSGVESFLNEAF